jgi:hypothetical protein
MNAAPDLPNDDGRGPEPPAPEPSAAEQAVANERAALESGEENTS